MTKYDSIIFDIDGTLWDSTGKVAVSYNRCLSDNPSVKAVSPITPALLKKEFGKPMIQIARDLFPSLSDSGCEDILRRLCARENEDLLRDSPDAYPGVRRVFEKLSPELPLFIVSNCQAGYIELFLQATGLGSCITDHLCPGDTGKMKAGNIRLLADRYALRAPVYVGDTLGDYEACREADVGFIFASYGFGNVPHPDYTIKTPLDLLKLPNLKR